MDSAERKKGFKFIDHIADAKFVAFGDDLEEAFENAGKALLELNCHQEKVSQKEDFQIVVESEDPKSLLYDFLEEILYLRDFKQVFFSSIEVKKIEKKSDKSYRLEGKVLGDKAKPEHQKSDIKAVTYNEMQVKETDKGYKLQVVLDL